MRPSPPRPLVAARMLVAATLLAAALVTQSAASATALTVHCGLIPGQVCITLTINLTGNGQGRFQSITLGPQQPDGLIDCRRSGGINSGTCAHVYDITSAGSAHVAWRLTPSPGSDTCSITCLNLSLVLTGTVYVYATTTDSSKGFTLIDPATVSVVKKGNGSGSVKSEPQGISCGSTCKLDFISGQPVTLTAGVAKGSVFGGWSNGPCSGKSATCTFTPTGTSVINATFNTVAKPTPVLTLGPSDSPTIEPSPSAGPSELVAAVSADSSASAPPSAPISPAAASDPPSSGSDTLPIAIAIVLAGLAIGAGLVIGLRFRGAQPPA